MKTFFNYVKMREASFDDAGKAAAGCSEDQLDALEKAIRLAFDKYPSQTKEFFKSLDNDEINELSADFEKQPSHDRAAEMYGRNKKNRHPDEVVPSHADTGMGEEGGEEG